MANSVAIRDPNYFHFSLLSSVVQMSERFIYLHFDQKGPNSNSIHLTTSARMETDDYGMNVLIRRIPITNSMKLFSS